MQLSLSINSISLGRSLGHLKELGKMSKRNLPRKGEDNQVNVMLATSEKLQKAYMLKEKFYNFVDSSDLESAKKNLKAWYMFVMSCELEEFDKCSGTIFNWQKYILNSFTCAYTNGYTEGVNNKIKVLKRNAYGVRNFWRFKNRIMHVMN